MTDWRIGTVGFGYADWAGVFYPKGCKSGDYLAYYAKNFNSLELDTTFHAIPPVERFRKWAAATPATFRFAVKAPRTVTHEPPLTRAIGEMFRFLEAAGELGEKLKVVLLQFPPSFTASAETFLRDFLDALPTGEMSPRYAIELRHPSWESPRTAALLAQRKICLVAADYTGEPAPIRVTTDFLYVRFIGEHQRFKVLDQEQIDVSARLNWWADQVRAHAANAKQVWVMANNDYAGYSIGTARRFAAAAGIADAMPDLPKEKTLFD